MSELRLVIVAEAPRDADVVKRLFGRAAAEETGTPAELRLVGPSEPFTKWADVTRLMRAQGVKPRHGHFDGKPGKPDAIAAANALRLVRAWKQRAEVPHAVVLQRDIDKQPERAEGLAQAKAEVPLDGTRVVVSVARPKLEAWVICAFEPTDAETKGKLAAVHQELGADPRACSHELDASEPTAKRNAKRVAAELLGDGDGAFEPLCETTSLETLRARGSKNGLAELLAQAKEIVAALGASTA